MTNVMVQFFCSVPIRRRRASYRTGEGVARPKTTHRDSLFTGYYISSLTAYMMIYTKNYKET